MENDTNGTNGECTQPYAFQLYNFELVKPDPSTEVPAPRNAHRILCDSKELFLYGGYNPCFLSAPNRGAFRELWRYNFATRKWLKCSNGHGFPQAVVSAAAVRRQRKILIYGGTGVPFGTRSSNKLYSIKLDDGIISEVETYSEGGPERMYGQAIFMRKSTLCVIGGTDGCSYNCDIHQIKLSATPRIWKPLYVKKPLPTDFTGPLPYQPKGRYQHEVVFHAENIYVFGGGTALKSYELSTIPAFNVRARQWQPQETVGDPNSILQYPQNRRSHGVVQLKTDKDTYVFVTGGYENAEAVFNDLWRLELSTLQWTLIRSPILPRALYFHGVTLTREGKMYIFGGIEEGLQLQRTSKMFAAWLCIPKLVEIAWEALLHYFPPARNREMLTSLQIPEHLIDRLR